MISNLNDIRQLSASADPDNNMPSKVNFDYYGSISDFSNSIDIQNSLLLEPFSILNCNIRSLNANFDYLLQMLADLKFPFTLIGVTETWINHLTIQWLIIFQLYIHLPGN